MTATTDPPLAPPVVPAVVPARGPVPHLTLRTPVLSGRVPVRAVLVAAVCLALLALAFAWSVSVGDFDIPLVDVARALTGGGEETTRFIVTELRVPRAAVGCVFRAAWWRHRRSCRSVPMAR